MFSYPICTRCGLLHEDSHSVDVKCVDRTCSGIVIPMTTCEAGIAAAFSKKGYFVTEVEIADVSINVPYIKIVFELPYEFRYKRDFNAIPRGFTYTLAKTMKNIDDDPPKMLMKVFNDETPIKRQRSLINAIHQLYKWADGLTPVGR